MRRIAVLHTFALLVTFSLLVVACGNDANSVTADPNDPGSEPDTRPSVLGDWILVGLVFDSEGVVLLPVELEITIADGQINGHTGCNSFFGAFDAADGGTLTLGALGMTEMACLDGGRMEFEFAYTQALSKATAWSVTPEFMVLSGDSVELRYEQAPARVNLPLEQTVWNFDTIYSGEGANRAATNRADMDGVTLVIDGGEAVATAPDCDDQGFAVSYTAGSEGEFNIDAAEGDSPECEVLELLNEGMNASTGFMIDENRLTFIGEAGETVGFSAS